MATSDDVLAAVTRLNADLREALRAAVAGTPHEPGRRMTMSEVLRSMLDAQQNRGGHSSSVTLSRNARGATQIEVTVRSGDSPAIETAADAHAEAVRIYDALRLSYPDSDGGQA